MSKTAIAPTTQILTIPRKSIEVDAGFNARRNMVGIDELSKSIEDKGLLQPVIVESIENNRYKLIAGFRRMAALDALTWDFIPAVVRAPGKSGDAEIVNLAENIQRADLSTFDVAKALTRIRDEYKLSANAIAARLATEKTDGLSVGNINKLTRLYRSVCKTVADEWAREHPSATINNLEIIVAKGADEAEQLKRWTALTTIEDENEITAPEDDTGSNGAEPKAPKKRSSQQIQKMIALMEEHSNDERKAAVRVLRWTLGLQKTCCGLMLETVADE